MILPFDSIAAGKKVQFSGSLKQILWSTALLKIITELINTLWTLWNKKLDNSESLEICQENSSTLFIVLQILSTCMLIKITMPLLQTIVQKKLK